MPTQPQKIHIALTKDLSTNRDWYEKSWAGVLNPLFLVGCGCVYTINKRVKNSFRFAVCFIKLDKMHWFWDGRDLKRIRSLILRYALTRPTVITNWIALWKKDWHRFTQVLSGFEELDITKLSNTELYSWHEKFKYAYWLESSLPYLVDSFLSSGEEDWLAKLITKEVKGKVTNTELSKIIATLTAPVDRSFSQQEHWSLLQITKEILRVPILARLLRARKINQALETLRKYPKLNRSLTNHTAKYFWVENSYYQAPRLTTKYFLTKISDIVAQGGFKAVYIKAKNEISLNRLAKKRLERSLKLSKRLKIILRLTERFSLWQDTRKAGVFLANDFIFRFLHEVARRVKLPPQELYYSIDPEIESILIHHRYNRAELRRRRTQGCAFMFTASGYTLLSGSDYIKLDQRIFFGNLTNNSVITGTPASPGKVTGIVRLVHSPQDFKLFKQGEVLVTNNTTPDFVPIMKRAAAIVTEQGGITTHAAVVSRELKVPCVIGTKIATKVLKTGDRVEVDATKGTVKKI